MRGSLERGNAHLLIILAAVGIIIYLTVSSMFPFKDKLFGSLYPKQSSHAASFTIGSNVSGITHYGYADTNPDCVANASYAVGGIPAPSPTSGGTGANLYVDPKNIDLQSSASVTATADPKCSINITPSFAYGLESCKGGCGTGGVTDGCTCSDGNPKDAKSCWWRWTCTATTAGSYIAFFNTVFLNAASSDLDADLVEMKRMGMKIIRVFAANQYITDNEAATRLGIFLDKANQYEISVIVSLIDFYSSGFSPQGTEQYYTGNYNGIGLLGHEFFATGYQIRYKDFVKTIVAANKDKSNIYAWEPGNELMDSSDPQTLISFMKDVTTIIKSIDNQHTIATGMLNAAHTGLSPQSLYSQLPDVNLITVHAYDGDRSGVIDVEWAKSNNKNVILEEFGYSGTSDRSAQYKNELDYWKGQGVAAVLQWGFIAKGLADNGNGDGKYGMDTIWHTDYDALAAVFQNYAGSGAPACDPSQVTMSVSPNPGQAGGQVTFNVSGNQGSTYIDDKWTGGVDCIGSFWGSKTCTATSSGNFSWTHYWKNCAPNDCGTTSIQCFKAATYDIIDSTQPAVTITYPSNGVTVDKNKITTIAANASDNVGIAKVEFYVNYTLTCTDPSSPYSCSWKVPSKPKVAYTITAKAYDQAGNTSSSIVKVTSK